LNEIKILNDTVVSKIAAGEIISRPLNIVKELVENSIDAKATNIIIDIEKNRISVEDNGTGINKQYVELAFMRHSTSKISSENDLSGISSLGFRGEALFAISVVSEVDLYTKTNEEEIGTHFKIKASKPLLKEDIIKNTGTKIIINDLFFNLPARKKHLKNFDYELRQITSLIEHLAIVNYNISFTLKINGNIRLYTSNNTNLLNAIYEVYGKAFASKLIDLDYHQDPLQARGFFSDLSAKSKTIRIISINKRLVYSKIIYSAIKRAYEELLGEGKGGGDYILFIELPFNMVDVNVHPSKDEVRFANETLIFMLIKDAVKNTLSSIKISPLYDLSKIEENTHDELSYEQQKKDSIKIESNASFYKHTDTVSFINLVNDELHPAEIYQNEKNYNNYIDDINSISNNKNNDLRNLNADVYEDTSKENIINKDELKVLINAKMAGHIFNRYIIMEYNNYLYLIDQHAAHERILYEQFINDFNKNNIRRQLLLVPDEKLMSISDILLIKENLNLLFYLGFELEVVGNSIKIYTVPIIASKIQTTQMLLDIINFMKNESAETYTNRNDLIIKKACVSAVKSDRTLNNFEVQSLIKELIKTKTPFICPHGRDTIIKVKKGFIDKLFGR
jgi:DNA mismatch repair protein MutL